VAADFAGQRVKRLSPVRIDTNQRVGTVGGRSATARSSSSPFFIDDGTTAAESRPATTIAPATSLDALLALQAVEDPLLKKKKLVRRGAQLLDTLEDMQADLLTGRFSESRVNHLMAVLSQAREKADPRLDALLDDIELRARVELAKRGVYPV
jgi:hypothetical protein